MKAQNKEEKQAKQQEREKLQREIAAREKAEKQKDEYEQRMREMKAEMEAKQVSQCLWKLGMVKLTDFGFSNKFDPGQRLQTSCGSLAYSAPEILLGDSYDAPAVGK